MTFKDSIQKSFRGEIANDPTSLTSHSIDTSLFKVRPLLVVAPKDVEDVKLLVRTAVEETTNGEAVSLTARSAGTDMTGGPLNEGVIVDFVPHFNRVLSVTTEEATTQPGVFYRDFDKETQKLNRILPSYPASRELCTVGGMVANNSGGEKTLTYGKTNRYVKKLKIVLADGNEYVTEPLTLSELSEKEKGDTFESKIYRDLHTLVESNYDVLQKAKPDVSKNSSGYALWDVLDKERGIFDINQLIVGSQGTLGLITEATFTLVQPHTHSRLLVIFLKDMSILGKLVNEVVSCGPESFESYDDHTFHVAMRLFPQIVRRLGGNIFKLGISFLPEFWSVLTGGVPKLVLLAEFTGDTDAEAAKKAFEAQKHIASFGLQTRITTSANDADKYWVIRRESFNLLRQKTKHRRTAPFIDDLIVRPEFLPEFLPALYEILDKYPLTYTIAGHMGDGNFHIIPLMDLTDQESTKIINELTSKVYALVWKYRGSNTAEHNDGLLRTPHLPEMYGREVYALFEKTKKIFDPLNIFNPGKKVNGSQSFTDAHTDPGE